MAIFRKVNNGFWEDEKVVDDFTPEDKYFMLYLMTNPHTNQVGCYQLTIRQMEFETGYNKDTILKLVKRFTEVLKVISYDENTKEVLILNWHKYNWTSSPKVIACIFKEAGSIKSSEFQNYIDTLFIQYGYSIDSECIPNRNKNKNKNKEEESKKTKLDPSINPIIQKFSEEYQKQFNSRLYLNYEQKMKLIEISSDITDFNEKIPELLEKFKNIEFTFQNGETKRPGLTWLIDKGNWTGVLNGDFDKPKGAEYVYNPNL